jgi:UDP-N-acetylglucosamine--N-acetylmuramyl-(pentapeptide) pyrophosphoryl-undecaprenol N-acetylglucosamine transferase
VKLAIEPHGGGAPSRARLALRTPGAVLRARESLVAHRSQVLLGLGGFTSLPAVLAARSLRIPVVLLEVNAHAGSATRWLSRFADRVLHAWRATLPHGEDRVDRYVGPPLAPRFHRHAALHPRELDATRAHAREQLGFDARRPLLVVLGGSQGSSALNTFVRVHVPAFVAAGVQVLHQTGPGKLAEAGPRIAGYRALEYVDPAHEALAAATAALVRGGASTLAEVAAMRVPAFVAPYPGHADRHQERNARELGEGVRIVQDDALDGRTRDALLRLCAESGAIDRAVMSAALSRAVPTDAAARIWDHIADVAARRRRSYSPTRELEQTTA